MLKVGDKVRVVNSASSKDNIGKTGTVFRLSLDPDSDGEYFAIEADQGFFKNQEGQDAVFGMFFHVQNLEKI